MEKVNKFHFFYTLTKLTSKKSIKDYVSLAAGHLPFFLHSVFLRVFAFAFFIVYLNEYACTVPILLIWFCNLLIGKFDTH